jgi:hypothetical protein
MGYYGAGGKLIHEKTRSKKSRDTVPLNENIIGPAKLPEMGLQSSKAMSSGVPQNSGF